MDPTHWIAVGVLAQLVLSLAHHLFRAPRQQQQLDSIEARVGLIVSAMAPAAAGAVGIALGNLPATPDPTNSFQKGPTP